MSDYRIIFGDDREVADKDYIRQIYEDIDIPVYGKYAKEGSDYVGDVNNLYYRYQKNPDTFIILVKDEHGRNGKDISKPIGYMNLFPLSKENWDEITYNSDEIYDDTIGISDFEDEDFSFNEEANYLFVLSIAIIEKERGKEAATMLSRGYKEYIDRLTNDGHPVAGVSADTISEDGRKFLSRLDFKKERPVKNEEGVDIFLWENPKMKEECSQEGKDKFDSYVKTYKDDLYMFIPFAEKNVNPFSELLDSDDVTNLAPEDFAGQSLKQRLVHEATESLVDAIGECMDYECDNDVIKELEVFSLGEFELAVQDDEYDVPDEKVINEKCTLRYLKEGRCRKNENGEDRTEVVSFSVIAHRNSHMFVLMVYVPRCRTCTSMLQDMLSHHELYVRKMDSSSNGVGETAGFIQVEDYMFERYRLIACGQGKSFVCMSNKPADKKEMLCMLAGETYVSLHQSFYIDNEKLRDRSKKENSRAIYDYYELYLTDTTVLYIGKNYDIESFDRNRLDIIGETSTYTFIVILMILQNTAINKMITQVSNALASKDDLSYEDINELYNDYSKTVKLWRSDNFRYFGTECEAGAIRKAFDNESLREEYYRLQDLLEHIVDVKSALDDKKSGTILNVVATVLAVIQVEGFLLDLINRFYGTFNINIVARESSFLGTNIFGGLTVIFIAYVLVRNIKKRRRNK